MSIKDVKSVLNRDDSIGLPKETRPLKEDEVQVTVRVGNASVTVTSHDNQLTVSTARVSEKEQAFVNAVVDDARHYILPAQDDALESAVMVVSQINEA